MVRVIKKVKIQAGIWALKSVKLLSEIFFLLNRIEGILELNLDPEYVQKNRVHMHRTGCGVRPPWPDPTPRAWGSN